MADYRPVVDSPLDHNAMLVLCVLDAAQCPADDLAVLQNSVPGLERVGASRRARPRLSLAGWWRRRERLINELSLVVTHRECSIMIVLVGT